MSPSLLTMSLLLSFVLFLLILALFLSWTVYILETHDAPGTTLGKDMPLLLVSNKDGHKKHFTSR